MAGWVGTHLSPHELGLKRRRGKVEGRKGKDRR